MRWEFAFIDVWFFCDRVDGGTLVQEEVLVQQADIVSSPISCSILVLWITSVAGDNRQAVERSGWYRTPIPLCETIWIISFCRLSVGRGLMRLGWGVVWLITGRTGGAQSTSKITFVSHSKLLYTFYSVSFNFLFMLRSHILHLHT